VTEGASHAVFYSERKQKRIIFVEVLAIHHVSSGSQRKEIIFLMLLLILRSRSLVHSMRGRSLCVGNGEKDFDLAVAGIDGWIDGVSSAAAVLFVYAKC
jgi:hypothetical protein